MKLTFAEGYTPEGLLARLDGECRHLLASKRGIDWDPWWRRRCGYTQETPLDDTHEARANMLRQRVSTPLISALRLPEVPWDCSHDVLGVSVAKWARAALVFIVDLEARRAAQETAAGEACEEAVRLASALRLAERQADAAAATAAEERARLEAELGAARASLVDALQARQQAERDRATAQSQAEAWRVSAGAAQASAEAARASVDIMRQALRIGGDEPGIVRRPG